jgi:hypothetical protein
MRLLKENLICASMGSSSVQLGATARPAATVSADTAVKLTIIGAVGAATGLVPVSMLVLLSLEF